MVIPMALGFVILFNLCACWTRLMKFIGLEQYTFSEVFDIDMAEEGVSILEGGN